MTRPHTEGFVPLESLSLAVSIPHSMWLQREARVQGRLGRRLFEGIAHVCQPEGAEPQCGGGRHVRA